MCAVLIVRISMSVEIGTIKYISILVLLLLKVKSGPKFEIVFNKNFNFIKNCT